MQRFNILLKIAPGKVVNRLQITGLAIIVFCAFTANAQKKDSINYWIPDTITAKISEYIKKEPQQKTHYALLQHQNDTTFILISSYSAGNNDLAHLVTNSNRYIKLSSSNVIPLLLTSDLLFSDKLNYVINKGTENELIHHTEIMTSGLSVVYKGAYPHLTLVKAAYFQY